MFSEHIALFRFGAAEAGGVAFRDTRIGLGDRTLPFKRSTRKNFGRGRSIADPNAAQPRAQAVISPRALLLAGRPPSRREPAATFDLLLRHLTLARYLAMEFAMLFLAQGVQRPVIGDRGKRRLAPR